MGRRCLAALVLAAALFTGSLAMSRTCDAQSSAGPAAGGSGKRTTWCSRFRWFRDRGYYDALLAAPRDAQINAIAYGNANEVPFQVEHGRRWVWDIDLGKELPIISWESTRSARPEVADSAWGIGLWIPIDFHMLEDHKDPSAPILNTDYRFSGMIKVQRGLGRAWRGIPGLLPLGKAWWGARIQYGHESTHLGDEYSLRAQSLFPSRFERINVSYEYLDLGTSYLARARRFDDFKAQVGVIATAPPNRSYYGTDSASFTVSPIGNVTRSRDWWEFYAGLEYRRKTFLTGPDDDKKWGGSWGMYGSLDLRHKAIYDYHKANDDLHEERQWSANLVLGLARNPETTAGLGRVAPYLRFYYGVNPHGQFRSQKDYFLGSSQFSVDAGARS